MWLLPFIYFLLQQLQKFFFLIHIFLEQFFKLMMWLQYFFKFLVKLYFSLLFLLKLFQLHYLLHAYRRQFDPELDFFIKIQKYIILVAQL